MTDRDDQFRDIAAAALAKAAPRDSTIPRPDRLILEAWVEHFVDAQTREGFTITLDAALRAVVEHYTEEHRQIRPADVIARARRYCRPNTARPPAEPRALPSRFETDAERSARIRWGVSSCRAEIDRRRARREAAAEAHQDTDQPADATGDAR